MEELHGVGVRHSRAATVGEAYSGLATAALGFFAVAFLTAFVAAFTTAFVAVVFLGADFFATAGSPACFLN